IAFPGTTTDASTAKVLITGSADQTYTRTGTMNNPTGLWTLNKTGGVFTLNNPLNLDAAGQKLTITNGAMDLNGSSLTVNSTFTNSGDFRFQGVEQVSTAPVSLAGSTITYQATSGTVLILSTSTYQHLTINGTGGTFNPPSAGLAVSENLNI